MGDGSHTVLCMNAVTLPVLIALLLLCSLISLEGADSGPPGEASAREMEATQRTVSCMSACRVEDIFADSKFLRAESLHELVKAIMWASGPIKRVASSGEESDTAQVDICTHESVP